MIIELSRNEVHGLTTMYPNSKMIATMNRLFPSNIAIADDNPFIHIKSKETIGASCNDKKWEFLKTGKWYDIKKFFCSIPISDIKKIPGSCWRFEGGKKWNIKIFLKLGYWHAKMIRKSIGKSRWFLPIHLNLPSFKKLEDFLGFCFYILRLHSILIYQAFSLLLDSL